ncbi:MAG: tetratricopeptide repeat protein [bacterium]|nr:tetratricopeptide repeat protein [bacterium]
MIRRVLQALVIVALVGIYGYRAVTGVVGGVALDQAQVLLDEGEFEDAIPKLHLASRSLKSFKSTRLEAEARVDLWEEQAWLGGAPSADPELLVAAAAGFLECLCRAPASKSTWEGFGDVYDSLEWIDRERRAEQGISPIESPWNRIGRSGRVALGMMRQAAARAPNWFAVHDRLAMTMWDYGLLEESRVSIRDSALALPLFWPHRFSRSPDVPDWMLDVFAEASWEMVGRSLLHPTDHLIDLGRLERRRGDHARAAEALRQALDGRASRVDRAEASYHLGLALLAQDDYDGGSGHLLSAMEHPNFTLLSLSRLALAAERAGRPGQALEFLRELRWEAPTEIGHALEFARVARRLEKWDQAVEALEGAKLDHPFDVRPLAALVETFIDKGDLMRARDELDDLERFDPNSSLLPGLRRSVDIAERTPTP